MKFNSNDPYQIAKDNEIVIVSEPLANIHGYYNNVSGQKFIHVSETIPKYFRRFVVAHLLYGASNNPEEMMFLYEKIYSLKMKLKQINSHMIYFMRLKLSN